MCPALPFTRCVVVKNSVAHIDLGNLTILLIDDNWHMRAILNQLLRTIGVQNIHAAADAVEGLEVIRTKPVDIVMCDHHMAPITGVEFCRMVRTSSDSPNPYLPIMLVTGIADRDTIIAARNAGVHDIVLKPISAKTLSDRLQDLILKPRNFVRTKSYFGPDRRTGTETDSGKRKREFDDTIDSLEAADV